MAFLRYAYARTVVPVVRDNGWDNIRVASGARRADRDLVEQASKILQEEFDPGKYLLTHATIVASVDTEEVSNAKMGKTTEGGKQIVRKTTSFRVKPECDKFINNNCLVPGTLITMADGTVKPIEEIKEGDEVLTHLGRARQVRAVMRRDVSEPIYEIKPRGTTERTYTTGEHPFFVFRENRCQNCGVLARSNSQYNARCVTHLIGKFYCSRDCWYAKGVKKARLLDEKRGEFVEAKNLTDRDFVTTPVLQETNPVDLTLAQARLIGLFAAEGYYELDSRAGNERVGVVWAFHSDETSTLVKTVISLMESEFGVECVVREHSNDNGIHVTTRTNRESVAFFSRWVRGVGSATKTLHPDLLQAPHSIQMEIVRGWMEGDGCLHVVDRGTLPTDVRLTGTTASRSLANQMQLILNRLGVVNRLGKSETSGRSRLVIDGSTKIVNDPTKPKNVSWTVSSGADSVSDLVQETVYEDRYLRAIDERGGVQDAAKLRFLNGYELQIIESIRQVDYTGSVYNFDVDEDHSYIANGVAVHNCDAWARPVLLKSYKTFIGAHSFVEHVQIENLSKGRIIDAVARDVGDSVYVDILVANDRKHEELIKDIESGKLSTLSMGCFIPGTQVTMADGRRIAIEDVQVGDLVLTHKGRPREVLNKQIRGGKWGVRRIEAVGVPSAITATDIHPFFVLDESHGSVQEVQAQHLRVGDLLCNPGCTAGTPITSIESQTYEGWVHDMEVEEDHSYVVEGVAVHNCTIDGSTCTKCGHWAADETEMCFPPGTRVLKSDGKYVPIEEIVRGDIVLTHTGAHREVLHTMSRRYEGHLTALKVEGVPTEIRATTNHPFWVLRPAVQCACGCGEQLRRTVEHERGAAKAFKRRFLPGHNSRVWNPSLGSGNVIPFEDYSKAFNIDLEFVPAGEVQKGDYLAFPIPQENRNTEDATERRARLIGYFLAEGSFIKRNGERVGVDFTFGSHETDTLAAEVVDLLNQEWGCNERRTSPMKWESLCDANGIRPIRRRKNSRPVPHDLNCPSCNAPSDYVYNARFKPDRDDCYRCKVCDRQWVGGSDRAIKARLYPATGENGGSCSVRLMSKEAADWFFRYCGEYAEGKQMHPDVLLWSPEIQKHVLLCWMNGDGTQCHTGVWGGTASFHLMSQMHVIAARCGWYSRKQVIFDGHAVDVSQVVNGRGESVVRDQRGWLPQFRLNISDPAGFGSEVRWLEPEKARVTLSSFTDGFKRVGNWMLYRVRDTRTECYSGSVYNIEVEGDNSYVVEGVAVHNCDHIKYSKGNVFYDDNGRRYRIAELCGDESLDPTGGVTFIEASWVDVPAFTGAVARNVVTVDTKSEEGKKTAKKLKNVISTPAASIDADAMRKAASSVAAMFDMEEGGDEGEGGENAPPASTKSPIEEIRDELKKRILDDVLEDLKSDVTKKKIQDQVLPPSTDPNDTVVKQAVVEPKWSIRLAKRAYKAALREIVKTSSEDVDLVNRVATLNAEIGIQVPVSVYRAALQIGTRCLYPSLAAFLKAARDVLGHQPTPSEARTLIRLASLLEARSNLSASRRNRSKGDTP